MSVEETPLPNVPQSVGAQALRSRAPRGGFAALARRARTELRLWRLYAIRMAMRLAPTEAQRLLGLTLVVGVLSGFAAVAFHLAIRSTEHLVVERAMDRSRPGWALLTILTPAMGAAISGVLLQYLVPKARGSGIPQVKATFAGQGGRLRFRDSVGKFVVGTLQIGTGSSLGREGPTVQICAGIASLLGRVAKVSPRRLRRLLPVGAAAGVAAAFNAPIAAVTFTIEEIVGNLDKSVLSGVIVAAAAAAAIERSILGDQAIFHLPHSYALQHVSSLPVFAMLGVAAAGVSILFTDSLLGLRARFRDTKAVPPWAQPAIGGLVTGTLAAGALHWLGTGGVTGGGYDTLTEALSGRVALKAMVALSALRLVATVFSYGSGGAGGIFAPSLFIGGMLGGAFGWVDLTLLGHDGNSVGAFALVGMGAVFAGIVRAPMTSVLIIVEMTNGYGLIVPLMIANMTAYGLARHLRPAPIYDALLEQDGIHLRDAAIRDALEGIPLEEVAARGQPFASFEPTTRARELMRASPAQEVFPVLAPDGRMVGVITSEELRLLDADLALVVNAADVMRPPIAARLTDDLHATLATMLENGVRHLPVLDDDGRVAAFVDEAAIAQAYLHGRAPHGAAG
jgi:CIC family chloride channel protein